MPTESWQLPGRGPAVADDRRDGEAGGGAYGGEPYERRPRRLVSNPENVKTVIEKKVKDTEGQISAKRLLPVVRAAGYTGSARNLRRAVHEAKARWRRQRRRYRPWVPVPGQHLVIDWTPVQGWRGSARCWPGRDTGWSGSPATSARRRRCGCWPSAWRSWAGCWRWCSATGCRACGRASWPTWWCRTPSTSASPPTTGSGPTSVSPATPSRREVEPSADELDAPAAMWPRYETVVRPAP